MKVGQLIEYSMRNIFLEKSYKKCGSFLKNDPGPFLKIKIEHISGSIFESFVYFVLIGSLVKDYQIWLKLSCRPLAFTSYKAFVKNKKRSGTSLSASFSAWFLKKNISVVILYYLTKFQCLVVFTSWDIGQYVYCNCLLTRLWKDLSANQFVKNKIVKNFEINLIFLLKLFVLHYQNVKTKS